MLELPWEHLLEQDREYSTGELDWYLIEGKDDGAPKTRMYPENALNGYVSKASRRGARYSSGGLEASGISKRQGGLEGGSQLTLGDGERDPTTQNGSKTRGEVPGSKAVAEGEDSSALTKNHWTRCYETLGRGRGRLGVLGDQGNERIRAPKPELCQNSSD
ncbi:hypothetical protein BKA83DRAFT_4480405 [Pisolithus microcarpus]|nr:hypothetical protein BKA83DRAFT_4480405 [Pisolithus microcarpus]